MKQSNTSTDIVRQVIDILVLTLKFVAVPAILILTHIFGMWLLNWWRWSVDASDLSAVLCILCALLIPALLYPLIFIRKKVKVLVVWCIIAAPIVISLACNYFYNQYEESITINTTPNINVNEYLPFDDNSKIVRLDHQASLMLSGDLPVIDGAAAFFPVYSAFVNATYPDTTELYDGVFNYNNTFYGYMVLAQKQSDIFIGVYPSEEQIDYAKEQKTSFEFTPIGNEAFVFFVNKNNPVNDLTIEQIKGIYSGEITNWSEVGGRNEPIAAFQRNAGSGSQSMLERFMDDTPIMEPPKDLVNDYMFGIIEQVSDYESRSGSIGFSFRYYVEGLIQNPDIKMLSVNGVAPTEENIRNGTYPILTPIYAVTWEGNENENVQRLLDWILSEEGQYIIEQTGYVPIN